MSKFVQDLWESIFTPGPTPSLLIATNVTFACLQVVLLALLVATYSIHFAILSSLCGGLWWAINWFAAELTESQKREGVAEKARATASKDVGGSSDSDTEVDTIAAEAKEAPATGRKEVLLLDERGELRHRGALAVESSPQGTRSSASTEDEWEKVSENEKEKEKEK